MEMETEIEKYKNYINNRYGSHGVFAYIIRNKDHNNKYKNKEQLYLKINNISFELIVKFDPLNFKNHIKVRHPDSTLNMIMQTLINPDDIFKKDSSSNNSADPTIKTDLYFQKDGFRVVIGKKWSNSKEIITAYKFEKNDIKTIYKNQQKFPLSADVKYSFV